MNGIILLIGTIVILIGIILTIKLEKGFKYLGVNALIFGLAILLCSLNNDIMQLAIHDKGHIPTYSYFGAGLVIAFLDLVICFTITVIKAMIIAYKHLG